MLLGTTACSDSAAPGQDLPEGSIGAQVAGLLGDSAGALKGASKHPSAQTVGKQLRTTLGDEAADEMLQDALLAFDEQDLDADLDELGDFLDEVILTDDNLQRQGRSYLYTVPSDIACGDSDDPAAEADCERSFAQLQPRVRVREAGSGVDLTLVVGDQDAEPVTVEVRPDRLGLVADMGQVQTLLESLGEEVPGRFLGVLAWSLQVHGEKDASLTFDVREPVEVDANVDGETLRLHIDRAVPLLSLRADAVQQRVTAAIEAGAIELDYHGDDGSARLGVEAVTGRLSMQAGVEAIHLTDLSLGDAPLLVTIDGETALSLELNRDFGGVCDVTLEPAADDAVMVTMAPALQVSFFADEAVLDDDPGADAVTLELLAQNDASAAVLELSDTAVLVHAGSLEVNASSGFETHLWSMAQGQCVIAGEQDIEGTIQSGVCVPSRP